MCRSHKNPLLSTLLLLAAAAAAAATAANPPSTLDPKQLTALQSIGLSFVVDPCSNPSPHNNATSCDSSSPFRHLISLRLSNCSPDLDLSPTALRSLHTLRSLSFFRCPVPPIKRFPAPLSSSLLSFSCFSSPRPLSASLLSHLPNLTYLSLKDVPISSSSPFLIFSQMHNLVSATISNTSLSGQLPRHWHSLSLIHLDLSLNALRGPLPGSISLLESLESLNLSSNSLSGLLPDAIGDLIFLKSASFARNSLTGPIPETMAAMPDLSILDLSFNQLNDTIPRFLSEMKSLKHLNLESNDFQGVIPFNSSFINGLEVFRVGGNSNLCYNRSLLSAKLMLGIAPCDKYGLPVPPPPGKQDKDDSFSDYDYGGDDDGGSGEKGGGRGLSKLALGVAIGLSCLAFLFTFSIIVKQTLSLQPEDEEALVILECYKTFMRGLTSLPISFPGGAYAKAIKARHKIVDILRGIMKRRRVEQSNGNGRGVDFLDILLANENVSEENVFSLVVDLLLGGYETTAMLIAVMVRHLSENQHILEELKEEHVGIMRSKRGERLGWDDYKKMEFTQCIISESLRVGNVVKFLHRETIAPVEFKGFQIPAGWKVLPIITGVHLDPSLHSDPSSFNPYRWKNVDSIREKSFIAFGGGKRMCPGYELSKLEASLFIHHLVLNYSWLPLNNSDWPISYPYLDFKDGFQIAAKPL